MKLLREIAKCLFERKRSAKPTDKGACKTDNARWYIRTIVSVVYVINATAITAIIALAVIVMILS